MIGGLVAGTSVSVHCKTQMTVIELRGDVDVTCVACLCQALVDALFDQRTQRLVVDLVRTTAIDPTGVEAIAAAGSTAAELHVPFTLRCPDPLIAGELTDLGYFSTHAL
jgi:anti-anti-sigma regulatory factor